MNELQKETHESFVARRKLEIDTRYALNQDNRLALIEEATASHLAKEIFPYTSLDAVEADFQLSEKLRFSFCKLGGDPNYPVMFETVAPYREALAEIQKEGEPESALHPFPSVAALNATVATIIKAEGRIDLERVHDLSDLYLFSASVRKKWGVVFADLSETETALTGESVFVASILGAVLTDDYTPFVSGEQLDDALARLRRERYYNVGELGYFPTDEERARYGERKLLPLARLNTFDALHQWVSFWEKEDEA